MKLSASHLLLSLASVAAPVALSAAPAAAQTAPRSGNEIVLSIGKGQLINLPAAMKDVFVADDKVADVQVKSNHQLYVFARGPGETNIYASNAAGQTIWQSTVRVGSNIGSVDQMLKVAMPDAKITVSTMGTSTVLLTGTVATPEDTAEAQRLVQAYIGKETNVITRLKTATPLQVNLQVRIAEVSRSLVKNLGVNFGTVVSNNGFTFSQGRSGFYTYDSGTGNVTINGQSGLATLGNVHNFFGMTLASALDFGETAGLVTTLAQPNLTVVSGESGDFLAGGEFPILISEGMGTTAVEYKKYGVSLSYTPTVLADGRISLKVAPEVSELSSEGAVTLSNFTVPALTVRRAETTIELGSGQSFMIAGLLKNNTQHSITKTPGAADVPVLGALFRSNAFQKGETELVIVVTPYLVKPVNEADIKLPTDGYKNPDDGERLLFQELSGSNNATKRPMPSAAPTPADPAAKPAEGAAKVSMANPAAAAPAGADKAAPGFNLN